MDAQSLTYLFVALSFGLYIGIAIWSRAGSTDEFYIAGGGVHPIANGMATAADWMSAASFISMAGIIAFMGYDGAVYLMGWTGGYVILALLLAPYLRKFGQFTVPDFIGTRYYSSTARVVAVICLILISFTYVAGQMRGVGIVFSQFLNIPIFWGVIVGMAIVFMYAVLGGMKGITYTQVAQYCVLIFAYLVPAIFISMLVTGIPIPQIGLGAEVADGSGLSVLDKLDQTLTELGFAAYTEGAKSTIDVFAITMALMIGTAGLPHVIVRFFTVPKVSDARKSAGYALIFIALLYTTAPAVGAFARLNFVDTVHNTPYTEVAGWFKSWENIGLIGWEDKNEDGRIQYHPGAPFEGKPTFAPERRSDGSRDVQNTPTSGENEVYVDRDIMVLANPEIAALPDWVIALVAAGSLAAALSTAAGLLLVISTSVSHDLMKMTFAKGLTDRQELFYARLAAVTAIGIAGYLGIDPPGFVAQVVAFAFGLAAASLFPAILLGIFDKRMNREGAIAGMLAGLIFSLTYIAYFKFVSPQINNAEHWLFEISPEGIGTVGAIINFTLALVISRCTGPVPEEVTKMVDNIRIPSGVGQAAGH
ncbi:MAG: cation acetate symporter [Halieaceae bacterium]|jgi:cation/acetate symporter|nr:cation acetate symporter [Halieaceae bacterium]MEC8145028.1 sodium:solute symporter family protein [Pseudomonadota bacterium]MEC8346984.1 sodium:solute symporter family protein [Pseudomonadota bacterium]MEC8620359.1 sodium:solute symporter family protein [Pseudomonadota bacterium]MEE2823836.1 sodium:solute symporter family protein [Pseudomonadota bacterium]|tara:strand:- start:614 stop:2386 length:1773 start_codon:yes stop_codon:yes gene_type:complete